MLPPRDRVSLKVMAIKGYSPFPKAPALLEPHHQIVKCHIYDTLLESPTLLQRCSRYILQPQPTGTPRDETLTGTTIPGQSDPRRNGNEEVLWIPQIFITKASSSDAIYCYTLEIPAPAYVVSVL